MDLHNISDWSASAPDRPASGPIPGFASVTQAIGGGVDQLLTLRAAIAIGLGIVSESVLWEVALGLVRSPIAHHSV